MEPPAIHPMNPDEVLDQLPKGVAPADVKDLQCKDASCEDGQPGIFGSDPETGMIPQDEDIEPGMSVPGAEPLEIPIMLDMDETVLQAPVEKPKTTLRYRLQGKHTLLPDGKISPALRKVALRAGGEVMQYVNWMDRWLLSQHQAIGHLLQEMLSELQEGYGGNQKTGLAGFEKFQAERQQLEVSLKAVQMIEEEVNKEMANEVLQTKTISMQEVRENYMDWVEPFAANCCEGRAGSGQIGCYYKTPLQETGEDCSMWQLHVGSSRRNISKRSGLYWSESCS